MTRVFQWMRLARAMGLRYVFFRVGFEIRRKTGLLRSAFPVNPDFRTWISLEQWRVEAAPFFFESRKSCVAASSDELIKKATRILNYEIQFFNGEWIKLDADDWLTNPVTGHCYDNSLHWTTIPDFHPTYGDIKYVWERSRFTFIQTILRYDAATGSDSSEWTFRQIESWIDNNPINCGPNYRCSQETSLRVFNWTLALYFYRDSRSLTSTRFEKILFHIYWQLKHVRSNIHFSRIAVRNNHAITETLALYTAGLLFPFFDEATEWRESGKKWFEQEIAYQIYEDGTYLQFSFNYHRVVVQLLTWAISLAEIHRDTFSSVVYERAYASLNVLFHSQDPVSGHLPNYGANDGSLFFQWNDESFRNYRPALDALHYSLTSASAFGLDYPDRSWFGLGSGKKMFQPIGVKAGVFSFRHGGIYGYRNDRTLCWIVCPSYVDRPSQADSLHVDLWHNGRNLLQDAGSYRYNTDVNTVRYFMGTESHNTVMIGDADQMLKGPRFIWLDWTRARRCGWEQDGTLFKFHGEAEVYRSKGSIIHTRELYLDTGNGTLRVNDTISGIVGIEIRQLWHCSAENSELIRIECKTDHTRLEMDKFFSPTYGIKEPCIQLAFLSRQNSFHTVIELL